MKMRLLLDDQYAPITSEIGFLKCPAKLAAEVHVSEARARPLLAANKQDLLLSHGCANLPEMLNSLLPLTSVDSVRKIYVQTNSEWTAYFSNARQGADIVTPMSYLARTIGCLGIRAGHTPNSLNGANDTKKGRYGATTLEIYAPYKTDWINTLRAVQSLNDGGRWTFTSYGEVQPFEEAEAYKAKRTRDRFTPEMLDRYLIALGINAFDEQFYTSSEGYYKVEKIGQIWPNVEYFTLAEARVEFT
jgi:hypothetical protein